MVDIAYDRLHACSLLELSGNRLFLRVLVNLNPRPGIREFEAKVEAVTAVRNKSKEMEHGLCSYQTLGARDTIFDSSLQFMDFGMSKETKISTAHTTIKHWESEGHDTNLFETAMSYNEGRHTPISIGHHRVLFSLIRFRCAIENYYSYYQGKSNLGRINLVLAESIHDRLGSFLQVQESKISEAFALAKDFIG